MDQVRKDLEQRMEMMKKDLDMRMKKILDRFSLVCLYLFLILISNDPLCSV
jgi:hypothetical protein